MTIGDLIFRLLADGSKLTPSVEKEAQKAGDAGAKTLGQRLSSGLKTNGLKAFGAVAATVFAGATKGALELEQIQARYQSETGESAEAASHAASVINRVAAENRLSLEEVADAAVRVHNDLGLTGDAADAMTARIAKFARVTRQQAGPAVSALDDISDAWNLTTEQQIELMDKLVVSHQQYGGSVEENQDALAKMAPQLLALNATVDDGIGLLNLFAASGIDASKSQQALNTAVKNLKPGQTLDDLVKDIAAIEDPTKRAQRAIEIFGSRGGVALANALKPGMDSLDDFKVTAEESIGAVNKSADALDSGFVNTVRKATSVALGHVREFGKNLGPALTGAASIASLGTTLFPGLGSKIAEQIGTGLGKSKAIGTALASTIEALPGVGAVKGAVESAGKRIGTALGAFAGPAFAAALIAVVGTVAKVATDTIVQPFQDEQVGKLIAKGTLEQLKAARQIIQTELNSAKVFGLVEFDPFGLTAGAKVNAAALDQAIADLEAKGEEGGQNLALGVTRGISSGAPAIEAATTNAVGRSVRAFKKTVPALVKALGRQIPESIAAGVLEKQDEPVQALNTLKDLMKNALTPSAQIARDIGILTSKSLAKGLADKRPAVREEAQRVQAVAEQDLAELIQAGGKVGKRASQELAQGLKSKNPQVRASAQRVRDIVNGKIDDIVPASARTGASAGRTLMASFIRSVNSAGVVTIRVRTSDITKGGRALGGPVKAGEPWWVGERGPEIFVPDVNGRVLSHADSVKATVSASPVEGMGGDTINLAVQGALPVRTIRDVSTELQRVQRLGKVPRKRIAPAYRRKEAGVG